MDEKQTIPEVFANRSIFITGGTGFIGKVLIEKLLRSCPDVRKIYLLVRPKRGKSIEERIKQITQTPLFDKLRETNPEAVKKIVAINGDTTKVSLGLSHADRQLITDEVSVIIHSAASVRFDDSLKEAIFYNVRSTREIAQLALDAKKLAVLLHVSTTYCHIDKLVIEEKLYPSYGNWREAILVAEKSDVNSLEALTAKYIEPFPNTYTFTKLLAEHVVNDMCVGKIPAIIYRPSVVISACEEPFTGWIDNFNGPTGLLVAGGKGILRTVYGDRNIVADYLCVDFIVKAILVSIWHKATEKNNLEISIYNASKYQACPLPLGEQVDLGKQLYWEVPFEKKLWFPRNEMTKNWYEYYLNVILFHIVPAILIDLILKIIGKKPMLFKIQRKIYIANMALSHFMTNEWNFVNTNYLSLEKNIIKSDEESFSYDIYRRLESKTFAEYREYVYDLYKKSCDFCRWYLLKESRVIKEKTRTNTKWYYILDCILRTIFVVGLIWLVFYKLNILYVVIQIVCKYWSSL